MGRKIVMLSRFDYAGSGYKMRQSVNLNTKHDVYSLNLFPSPIPKKMKRSPSLVKEYKGGVVGYTEDFDRTQSIIDDADIIHFKGDYPPTHNPIEKVSIPINTPIIVTVHGSMFRRSDLNMISDPVAPLEEYVDNSDLRTAGDPCLLYPEYDGIFTPVPIDLSDIEISWEPKSGVISHSPTGREKKGTQKLLDAVDNLNKRGYKLEVDIIENVPHTDAIARKSGSVLFFDQCECGFYGNSAIEAMAMGIPTACYMADEAFKWSGGKMRGCPVINTGNTVETIEEAILNFFKNKDQEKISIKTRKWIEKLHSYESVGKMWGKIYEELCQ